MILRALVLTVLTAAPLWAQSDPSLTAQRAAQMLDRAALSLQEAEGASDRVAALTETVEAYEEGLRALREGLRQAVIRERAVLQRLSQREERVQRLLGVLQTLSATPPELLLVHPGGPLGTARAGMIVGDVTPALQAQVADLHAQVDEVRTLRQLQEQAASTLSTALQNVQTARTALSTAVAERTNLPRRFEEDPEAILALVQSSDTLDSFAAGLITGDETAPQGGGFEAQGRGALPLPVAGMVLRRFQQADAAGLRRPGWVIAAPARSLVRAPWTSTLRYAGPLLDYGNVVLLEPASDFLIVIAGLDEVYGTPGEIVSQHDPIGLMGGAEADADATLTEAATGRGGARRETLYVEVRQGTEPVDPALWFRLNGN